MLFEMIIQTGQDVKLNSQIQNLHALHLFNLILSYKTQNHLEKLNPSPFIFLLLFLKKHVDNI